MTSASKSTFRLNNLKILRPKVTKILQIFVRSSVNPNPVVFNPFEMATHIMQQILYTGSVSNFKWQNLEKMETKLEI